MQLILLRHGKASSAFESRGLSNESLPLTEEGRRELHASAKTLNAMGLRLSSVLTSPLLRACQSAEIFTSGLEFEGEIEKVDCLNGSVAPSQTLKELRGRVDGDAVLVVGHAPFMGHLAAYLLTGQESEFFPFRKGQVAAIDCSSGMRPGAGVLLWSFWPEQLAMMAPPE